MIRVYGSTIIGKGMTSFDEDATIFINAAGITEQQQKDAVNFLVQSLKKKHLWDSFEALYPVVGANAIAHSFNLINPSKHRITWGGNEATIQHTLFGMTLKTGVGNLNLTTNDVGLDSICSSFYVGNTVAAITYDITNQSVQNDRYYVHLQYNDNRYMFTCGNAYGDANLECNVNEVGTAGLMTTSHEGNWMGLYKNGELLTSKTMTASMAPSGRQLIMNSTSFNNDRQFRLVAFHKNFSESQMVILSNIIQEYQSMLNRAVGENSDFDTDSLTFIETAGLAQSKQQTIVNDLVKDLKKIGVWGKLAAIYPFIGGNANAHSYNLKNPEKYKFTWGNQSEHSALGVVPRKQGHLFHLKMSEINPNAGNNLSISMYLHDDGSSSNQTGDVATINLSTPHTAIYKYNNGNIRLDNGYYTKGNTITAPRKKMSGFFNGIALDNKLFLYQNGELLDRKQHTPADVQELELQYHYDSATVDNKAQCRFLSFGNGLTSEEVFLLNEVIQKYQEKLNRTVETDEIPDADVSAFIEAAQIKDPNQQLAVNYLTHSLKSAGLWDKFTTLYPLVGGTYDSCKYNLIDIAQNILSNAEGVVYSKKGIMPNNNVEIGSFNNLFPNYNANLESSFDMYIQEDIESTTHDLGFEDTKNGFCIFSNYTGREVYYLSAYTGGNNVTEEKRISKIVNVPTNGLFSGQSKTGNLSVYKNGKVLISETKTPQNIPDYPVFIMKNIRTLSLVATRKSNLTDAEFITYNNIIRTYQRILNRDVNYEAETEAFVQASGISDITYKKNIDIFIKDLKTEGLFEKFYALYLYSGIAFDKRGYNLIDVKKYKLEFGATTEHVNDGIIPHTSTIFTGINFSDLDNPLKSFSFLHRSKDGESMGSSNVMEGSNSTSYWDFMIYTNPSSNMYRFDFGTKVQIVTATVPATGLLSVNILNGTNKIIKEGNVIASTTTTPVSLTGDIRINHSDANFDNKKVFQLHAIGKGFSDEEHALISSIFNNFLTKTGHL